MRRLTSPADSSSTVTSPAAAVVLAVLAFACVPATALAQHNATRNVVPASGLASHLGAAREYPWTVTVTEPGIVHSVTVTLHNFTHSCPSDLDILLSGPDDTSVVLMSDVGGCTGLLATRTFTFSDHQPSSPGWPNEIPDGGTVGTADWVGSWADSYPPPAPMTAFKSSLLAFRGTQAAGQWRLFVVDDKNGDRGEIQAWTLAIRYSHRFNSSGGILLPGGGSTMGVGTPYPSTTFVGGVTDRVDKVVAGIGITHEDPDDVDLLLVSPGGQGAVLMSDVGGLTNVQAAILAFDDESHVTLPDEGPLTGGTYRPANYLPSETFEAPAPAGTFPASMAVLESGTVNGVWKLFARDDAAAGVGSIDGWWVDVITVKPAATPYFTIEAPATLQTTSPVVHLTALVDLPNDVVLTWRNALNGAVGVATRNTGGYFGASVPVAAGSNLVTMTLTNAAGERTSRTVVVKADTFVYTFSEGATGPFFDLDLAVFNPGSSSVQFEVKFLTPGGTFGPKSYGLQARSRLRLPVESLASEYPALGDSAVSTVITSTSAKPLVAERTMFWGAGRYGGHAGSAVSETSRSWYFAEGSQGFFDTFVLLSNANATVANVTVTFLLESGDPVVRKYPVEPGTRFNVWAAEIPELMNRSFGITVTSDLPITAERAMYFSGPAGRPFEGGHESAGVPRAAREWFFAEGATGPYFDTYILVSNPTSGSVPVTFTYRTDTGQVVKKTLTAAPHSRLTVNVETQDAKLADVAVSTTVSAPVPVVAERAMYWPGTPASWHEAHNSFGLTETGELWSVADGRAGGAEGFETYILLVNPEKVEARVLATFARPGLSSPVQKLVVVPPNSRMNVTLAAHAPEVLVPGAVTEFSVMLESGNLTRIAVERATYWNSGGSVWAGGSNVTGTRLR